MTNTRARALLGGVTTTRSSVKPESVPATSSVCRPVNSVASTRISETAVADGRQVVSDEIRHSLDNFSSIPEMSPRKLEILNLVAKGFSNKEIAGIIGVSPVTVKDHVAKIFLSLGASTRAEAVSTAINLGLITG